MGKTKKITCLIFILLLVLSLFFPAYADDTSSDSDSSAPEEVGPFDFSYSNYYLSVRKRNSSLNWGSWSTLSPTPTELPSSRTYQIVTDYGFTAFETCFAGKLLDKDGNAFNFQFDWAYTFGFSYSMTAHEKFNPNDFDYYLGFLNAGLPSSADVYPVDSSFLPDFASDVQIEVTSVDTSSSSTNYTYNIYCAYSFHLTSEFPFSIAYGWVGNFISSEFTAGTSPANTPAISLKYLEMVGRYDPAGQIDTDSEVDQIIQGQKDAVDYQMAQEELKTGDAASSAADVDTSAFSIGNLADSLSSLYNGVTYTGDDFTFSLPASGVIPFLGVELWGEKEIPLKMYIDMIPTPILIVCRFAFWFFVARVIIKFIYKILDLVNGHGGGAG